MAKLVTREQVNEQYKRVIDTLIRIKAKLPMADYYITVGKAAIELERVTHMARPLTVLPEFNPQSFT